MNPQLPDFIFEIYDTICESPEKGSWLISKKLRKNRSLSSKKRKAYTNWMMMSLRFRSLCDQQRKKSVRQLQAYIDVYQEHLDHIAQKYSQQHDIGVEQVQTDFDMPTHITTSLQEKYSPQEMASLFLGFSTQPSVHLRINRIRADYESVSSALDEASIAHHRSRVSQDGIVLDQRAQLTQLPIFKKGGFEVQDTGSQFVAQNMQVEPGQFIIDGCARTGGKSLAMASLTGNEANIHAVDVDARVFDELGKRAKRAGVSIQTHWVAQDDPRPMQEFEGCADRVLVDAPCSSLGTLARKPWLKWQYGKDQIDSFAQTQELVLHKQSKWVKPGGLLGYCVCSILPEENSNVVAAFLSNNPEFTSQAEHFVIPPEFEGDGFYFHLLARR